MQATRTPVAARLAAAPAVVLVVLAGVWLTGGVVTDEFRLAMGLTAAWMAVAGLICLGIAVRNRPLRWPVLVAYAVTAATAAAYLGSSQLFDKEVNERVAQAAQSSPQAGPGEPRNVALGAGRFQSVRHEAAGTATAIRLADGDRVLTLTGFSVANGPDLRIRLVAGPAGTEREVDDVVDLGALKGNKGNQQYAIPRSVDLERYSTAVIWCRAFSVLFARAPLRP